MEQGRFLQEATVFLVYQNKRVLEYYYAVDENIID